MRRSFGDVLDENRGIGKGFDTMRVVLAFSVIAWHSLVLVRPSSAPLKSEFGWTIAYSIVPMFFALSGFLVTGSALRLRLGQFALSRALRIVPALAVDTLITVLLIGPVLTTLTLADFWSSSITHRYLLNIIGEIHFYLPGVFDNNPQTAVNGSLWTIRPELGCYAAIGVMIATGWIGDWRRVLTLMISFYLIMILVRLINTDNLLPGLNWFAGPGAKLVPLFLSGSLAYLLREKIIFSASIFSTCCIILLSVDVMLDGTILWDSIWWVILTVPVLTYAVLFLGLCDLPRLPIFNRGDYSYGVYLYAYPIQQAIIYLSGTRSPAVVFTSTLIPVVLVAMASWHLIEKPMLRFRKGFSLAAKLERERKASVVAGSNEQHQ